METTLTITREEIQANNPITVLHLQGWLDAKGEENLLAAARAAYSEGARPEWRRSPVQACGPCTKFINYTLPLRSA